MKIFFNRKRFIFSSLALLFAAFIIYLLIPHHINNLVSRSHPAFSFEEAVHRIDSFRTGEPDNMNSVCHTLFLSHGFKTKRVIVLFHGYTNCPEQFSIISGRLFDSGYNVLVLPMKYHGLADRLSRDHASLTAEYLAAYTDEAIDIARGLGDHITIAGLSLGGILTAWAAQNRNDVDLALVIAPSIGFKSVPAILTGPIANLFWILPNYFIWWNDKTKGIDCPQYAYPQFSTKALAQTLRLGFALQKKAGKEKPLAKKILMITNASDKAINNELVYTLAGKWKNNGAIISTFEFEDSLHLNHDLIDPNQPDQRIDIVYPKLIDIIISHQ